MTSSFHITPGLAIALGLLAAGVVVGAIVAVSMARSGVSPRPAYWFAGMFALVVLPQVLGHGWMAMRAGGDVPAAVAAPSSLVEEPSLGPDVDPSLVSDLRRVPGGPFAGAERARFAVLPQGQSVLLARFADAEAAARAASDYLRLSGLGASLSDRDVRQGKAAARATGDRAYVLLRDRWFGVWTGPDDDAIRHRLVASGLDVPQDAPPAGHSTTSTFPATPPWIGVAAAALALYLFAIVLFFFKGAAWAGTVPPAAGTPPVPAAELATRLQSVNALDAPWRIEPGETPNDWIVTWRYADATWLDLSARVSRTKRAFRIHLHLDEASATVRATDQVSAFDASAGPDGANLSWRSSLGIVFFQRETQRVFGLQIGPDGRFVPALSHAWRFDANEMKAPLIEAVTRAGWRWRPTVWQGPSWLRWLTE